MKNVKRFIALVLALTMCVATLATIGATDPTWEDRQQNAINQLERWGIDNIGPKADQPIDRDTFVYWMAEVVEHQLIEEAWTDLEAAEATGLVFADVDQMVHPAAVAYAKHNKWVYVDDPDTANMTFRPTDTITLAEASKLIVRVMGYDGKVDGEDEWQYQYMHVANIYCHAYDNYFLQETGQFNPDYALTYGTAAYLVWTIMNGEYHAQEQPDPTADLILTIDGIDLGAWFADNGAVGTKSVVGTVIDSTSEGDNILVTFQYTIGEETFIKQFTKAANWPTLKVGYGVILGFGFADTNDGINQDDLRVVSLLDNVEISTVYKQTNGKWALNSAYTEDKYFTVVDATATKAGYVSVFGEDLPVFYITAASGVTPYALTAGEHEFYTTDKGSVEFIVTDMDMDGRYDRVVFISGRAFTGVNVAVDPDKGTVTATLNGYEGDDPQKDLRKDVLSGYEIKTGYIQTATTVHVNGMYTLRIVTPEGTVDRLMPVSADFGDTYTAKMNLAGKELTFTVFDSTTPEGYEDSYPLMAQLDASIVEGIGSATGDVADPAKRASAMVNKYIQYIEIGNIVVYAIGTIEEAGDTGLITDVATLTEGADNTFNVTILTKVEDPFGVEGFVKTATSVKAIRANASSLEDYENYSHYHRLYTVGNFIHDLDEGVIEANYLSYGRFVADAGDFAQLRYVDQLQGELPETFHKVGTQLIEDEYEEYGFQLTKEVKVGDTLTGDDAQEVFTDVDGQWTQPNGDDPAQGEVYPLAADAEKTINDYDELPEGSYIEQYTTTYGYKPFYNVEKSGTGANTRYLVVRYFERIETSTFYNLYTPIRSALASYLAVYNENGVQMTEAEWNALQSHVQDDNVAGEPVTANYKVIGGYVYRVNTIEALKAYDATATYNYNVYTSKFTVTVDDEKTFEDDADDVRFDKYTKYTWMRASNFITAELIKATDEGDVIYGEGKSVEAIANTDYLVTLGMNQKYVADSNTTVMVVSPTVDVKTKTPEVLNQNVKEYTMEDLVGGNLGVWATRFTMTFVQSPANKANIARQNAANAAELAAEKALQPNKSDAELEQILRELNRWIDVDEPQYYLDYVTVIGEVFDLSLQDEPRPTQPDDPQPPQPDDPPQPPQPDDPTFEPKTDAANLVYLANGESVVEQEELYFDYVVRSQYSAVDVRTGDMVGTIERHYPTYLDATRAEQIDVIIKGDSFYTLENFETCIIDAFYYPDRVEGTVLETATPGILGGSYDVFRATNGVYSDTPVALGDDIAITATTKFKFAYIDYQLDVDQAKNVVICTPKTLKFTELKAGVVRTTVNALQGVTDAIAAKKYSAIVPAYDYAELRFFDVALWENGDQYSATAMYFEQVEDGFVSFTKAYLIDGTVLVFTTPYITRVELSGTAVNTYVENTLATAAQINVITIGVQD